MIIKNNGQKIVDPYPINSKTTEYLSKFWKFPSKEEIEKEREQLLTTDKNWALAQ